MLLLLVLMLLLKSTVVLLHWQKNAWTTKKQVKVIAKEIDTKKKTSSVHFSLQCFSLLLFVFFCSSVVFIIISLYRVHSPDYTSITKHTKLPTHRYVYGDTDAMHPCAHAQNQRHYVNKCVSFMFVISHFTPSLNIGRVQNQSRIAYWFVYIAWLYDSYSHDINDAVIWTANKYNEKSHLNTSSICAMNQCI